jgi:hypothetical protein
MKEWLAKKSEEEGYGRSRLPSFTSQEVEMMRGEFDFISTKFGGRNEGQICAIRYAQRHEQRHINVESLQLLHNDGLVRRLQRTKPFELV